MKGDHGAGDEADAPQARRAACVCSVARSCSTDISDESVHLDVRTTLPVKAARLLDGISTGVPVTRATRELRSRGRFTHLNRELGPSNGLNWGQGIERHDGHAFRPIRAIALHGDSVIAETAFPQGKILGERRQNWGRSPLLPPPRGVVRPNARWGALVREPPSVSGRLRRVHGEQSTHFRTGGSTVAIGCSPPQ